MAERQSLFDGQQSPRNSDASSAWVLVVEDEPRLRDELVALLEVIAPDFGNICAVGTAEQALALCTNSAPDIAFVDIKLPGQSGLDLALALPITTRIVFVTAHADYAVAAFDRDAVDYVLKPLSRERLARAVERLRARATLPSAALRTVLTSLPKPRPAPALKWLAASSGRRTHLVAVDDIVYLQSDNKYTRIVSRDAEYLMEESIKTLLQRLDAAVFLQVHRSTIVNLREVLLVERDETGAGLIQLRSHKDVLRISAPFLKAFKAFLA